MKILVKNYVTNKAYYKEVEDAPYVGTLMDGGVVASSWLGEINEKVSSYTTWIVVIEKESIFSKIMRKLGF